VRAGTPAWSKIKTASGGLISAIAVAPGNSKVVWVGYDNGDVYKTSNGTSANPNWTKVDGATLPNRYVTRIAIRKGAPNTVYVTFGGFFDGYTTGNIWRTKNGGSSWANKHGVLPQAPIRSVVMHPKKANVLYVGTEVGIFFSTNSGNPWNVPQAGPTNTSVDELFFLGNTLYAATHGRGVFKNTHTLPPLPPVAVSAAETAGTAPADE
jgi:photosystem II stability/assembly factor-like uncharacterized protein